jgi:hypothetical protein
MFTEFDNIASAFKEFQHDFTIQALWYDDLKRKIVVERPHHANEFLLTERGNQIDIALAKDIANRIADWHAQQYTEMILKRADMNPISYNELLAYLTDELRIFYDAAKVLDSWILESPESFGLQKVMHHEKSLCFIPIRKH